MEDALECPKRVPIEAKIAEPENYHDGSSSTLVVQQSDPWFFDQQTMHSKSKGHPKIDQIIEAKKQRRLSRLEEKVAGKGSAEAKSPSKVDASFPRSGDTEEKSPEGHEKQWFFGQDPVLEASQPQKAVASTGDEEKPGDEQNVDEWFFGLMAKSPTGGAQPTQSVGAASGQPAGKSFRKTSVIV